VVTDIQSRFFPNLVNDTAVIGRHLLFKDMENWIFQCINYASNNPDMDLIIRVHPAENLKIDYRNPTKPTDKKIIEQYPNLPPNIILIPADSSADTYTLLKISQVVCTYTGTIALEAPFYNKLCIVAGESHFKNKGYTMDFNSKGDFFAFLNKRKSTPKPTKTQINKAKHYAYFYRYRVMTEPPFYDFKTKNIKLLSFNQLLPNGSIFWDNFIESLIYKKAFIDLDKPNREPLSLDPLTYLPVTK